MISVSVGRPNNEIPPICDVVACINVANINLTFSNLATVPYCLEWYICERLL